MYFSKSFFVKVQKTMRSICSSLSCSQSVTVDIATSAAATLSYPYVPVEIHGKATVIIVECCKTM